MATRMERTTRSIRSAAAVAASVLGLGLSSGEVRADGIFAVMSYNVKGLYEIPFIVPNRTDQMHDIAEKLEDFHTADGPYFGMPSVVGLQEVFTSDYYKILTNPETVSYAFITDRHRGGNFNTGDGLTMLSDFPLSNLSRTKWEMCNGSLTEDGSDCDTPKGFSFVEVTLEPGATFHLYTLHADAGQGLEDQAARRSNVNQLIAAINLNSPEGTAVIVLGDTNSRYTREGTDNIQDLLVETGVRDVWVELRRGGIPPSAGPSITEDCETTPSTANCEEVDKIFYRNGDQLVFEPKSYQVLRQMFMGTRKPLSDHDPVVARLEYAVVPTTVTSTTSTTTTTLGDRPCGDPVAGDEGVAASDALFVLRTAVGAVPCPLCICDVNDTATVTASDSLLVLRVAVGQNATLLCPQCDVSTTSSSTTTTTTMTAPTTTTTVF
jgi:endonuclease/exonuclease/phosphatase family metal-dependent hydrolase